MSARPSSNCGLTRLTSHARSAASSRTLGSTSHCEMKLTSITIASGRSPRRSGVSARASRPSSETTRLSAARRGASCPRPTSTAITFAAPRAKSTSVKPPVEAPTSRQTRPEGSSAKASSAAASLTPPRDAHGWGASASIDASSATSSDAFLSAAPPTLTSPAAIAACARARLEKKPRSTRRISARLRIDFWAGGTAGRLHHI